MKLRGADRLQHASGQLHRFGLPTDPTLGLHRLRLAGELPRIVRIGMPRYSSTPVTTMMVKPISIGRSSRSASFEAGTFVSHSPSMRRSMTISMPRLSVSATTWSDSIHAYM